MTQEIGVYMKWNSMINQTLSAFIQWFIQRDWSAEMFSLTNFLSMFLEIWAIAHHLTNTVKEQRLLSPTEGLTPKILQI